MEFLDIARIFFALIAVVGMIGLCAVAAKKLGLQNGVAAMGRAKRLALVESVALDQRRRLAIVSCDGREHLLVLDQSRVTVIERGIPERAAADAADPIAARADAPLKPLHIPHRVVNFLHRAPRDETVALRAAGII